MHRLNFIPYAQSWDVLNDKSANFNEFILYLVWWQLVVRETHTCNHPPYKYIEVDNWLYISLQSILNTCLIYIKSPFPYVPVRSVQRTYKAGFNTQKRD